MAPEEGVVRKVGCRAALTPVANSSLPWPRHWTYGPCHSDASFTIFSCDDELSIVSEFIGSECKTHGVGCIVVPINVEDVFVYRLDMTKCFGDTTTARLHELTR